MSDVTPPLADTTSSKKAKAATATADDTTSTAPADSAETDPKAAGDSSDSALTTGEPDPAITSTSGEPAVDETDQALADTPEASQQASGTIISTDPASDALDPVAVGDPSVDPAARGDAPERDEPAAGAAPADTTGGDDTAEPAEFGDLDSGAAEPLGEEKRENRVRELEDAHRDTVEESTAHPEAADEGWRAPGVDTPVGDPIHVHRVERLTSYVELVAELELAIDFVELAAFNGVVNQRYELYPGDTVKIPQPTIPGRIDGVEYDD